jgi:hypothetical protein
LVALIAAVVLLTSGCGLLFGRGDEEQAPEEERVLVPTFTPTTEGAQPTATLPTVVEAPPAEGQAQEQPADTPATPLPEAPTPEPTVAEPTPTPAPPTPVPKLVVQIENANVRSGPGTDFGLVGNVTRDQAFDITGKNQDGTWWQFCCVNGQPAWIFGELVGTENAESVAVAENLPAPPPVAAAPPAAPTNTPAPAAPAPEPAQPAPPPAGDPCAGIGGDGCKFKVRNGPKFGVNGGGELKLQLLFVHSGVEGGQPQGSYFVALFKDGAKLPIGDNVRSIALSKNPGALGEYNYEYKLGLDKLPGNTVAGNYTMYVLDGNGERDSGDLNFTVPDAQSGDVWIEWDQG